MTRTKDPEAMDLIAALINHPGYAALVEQLALAREQYFANFAKGLMASMNPIDQREVDEKRGFWKGAHYALNTFPKLTAKDWEKFVAVALIESEKEGE